MCQHGGEPSLINSRIPLQELPYPFSVLQTGHLLQIHTASDALLFDRKLDQTDEFIFLSFYFLYLLKN